VTNASAKLEIEALTGIPLVKQGDDLALLLINALKHIKLPTNGDVLVIAQKIVSKAEGRTIALQDITPTERAIELAAITGKDPSLVQLVLQESKRVVRAVPGVLIVEHKLGLIHANAGIDNSNVGADNSVLLLPEDPSASARQIAQSLSSKLGTELPVIINDSSGRAWRNGVVGMAIGCAGIMPVWDRRGTLDLHDRAMEVTEVGAADELAAAASWLMGQGDEGIPAVLIREAFAGDRAAGRIALDDRRGILPILRNQDQDLFR
jgi:coenzyme F420-0:L-glutamate ligase/coenzyme F420-1:gamma-L-glutamate ligase